MGCSASSTAALSQGDAANKKDAGQVMDKNSTKDKGTSRSNRVSVYSKGRNSDSSAPPTAIRLSTKTPKEPVPPERAPDVSTKNSQNVTVAGTASKMSGDKKMTRSNSQDLHQNVEPPRPKVTVRTMKTTDHSRNNTFLIKGSDNDRTIKEESFDGGDTPVNPLPKKDVLASNKVAPVNGSPLKMSTTSTRSPVKAFQTRLSPVKIIPLASPVSTTELGEDNPIIQTPADVSKKASVDGVAVQDPNASFSTITEVKALPNSSIPSTADFSRQNLTDNERLRRISKESKNVSNEAKMEESANHVISKADESSSAGDKPEIANQTITVVQVVQTSDEKVKSPKTKTYTTHHPHYHHHHHQQHWHHHHLSAKSATAASYTANPNSSVAPVSCTTSSGKPVSPDKTIRITSQDEKTKFVFKTVKSRDEPDGADGDTRDILIQTDVISTNENNEKTKKKLLIKMRKIGSKGDSPVHKSVYGAEQGTEVVHQATY
ncbi:hypothetical protein Btru_042212 [Bulinus truncatus]|nr:hypothetical protein Btru_042212 [Bulinus truncatus]